jgi:hypothetical protein
METLFLFCAIFGGTVLVAQFLLGFGGDHGHGGDGAEDAADHLGGDHGAAGDDHDTDAHGADTHADTHDSHAHGGRIHHGSTWVFGVLTFRTVMIGLTFFGLTGKAAMASGFGQPRPLLIAVGCGLAAMYGVYFLMRGLYRLTADGTERIERAVGVEGMVYLTVPGNNEGLGKVQVPLQNRTVEYEAMTGGERLPTGTRIVVVGILGSGRVEVEPVIEPARNSNV